MFFFLCLIFCVGQKTSRLDNRAENVKKLKKELVWRE